MGKWVSLAGPGPDRIWLETKPCQIALVITECLPQLIGGGEINRPTQTN